MKKLLHFQDLREANIVRTWNTLNDWIDNRGFPPGRMIGKHRVWTDDEVVDWIKKQPTAKLAPRGNAKRLAQR
jgi:hypothetical protein